MESITWPYRRDRVASVIRFHKADLVGMQEVLRDQISDPGNSAAQIWLDRCGQRRRAGRWRVLADLLPERPFYRVGLWDFLAVGNTEEVTGGKSWDAAITRIANWVILLDLQSNQEFRRINTHFDHRGEVARTNSAALIVARLKEPCPGRAGHHGQRGV